MPLSSKNIFTVKSKRPKSKERKRGIKHYKMKYTNMGNIAASKLYGPGFNLSSGFYLCGVLHVLPRIKWVFSGFFGFLLLSQKHPSRQVG